LALTVLFWILLFVNLLGLGSLLVPGVPGFWIMWIASLIYGIVVGFDPLGIAAMVLITILSVFGSVVDNLLIGVGARKGGASWSTILVALLAGVLGTALFPPFGGFIAVPVALLLLEYGRHRDLNKAWQTLIGLAGGWGASVAVRFLIGLVILGLWLLWVWKS
jgi:uncharacterized protein YqgC (DUF456 family)